MRSLPDDLPRWPAWLALGAPAAAWASALLVALLLALVLGVAGIDGAESPAVVLVAALLTGAAAIAALAPLLRRHGAASLADVGLRPVAPRLLALALLLGAAGVAAVTVLAALLDAFAFPQIPAALSEVPVEQRGATDVTRVTAGPGVALLLLAVVLLAALGETVLRGVVLPALTRASSLFAATAIVAGVSALIALVGGVAGAVVLGVVVLNLLNGWLFAETGSVVAGVAVAAASGGVLLAGGVQWSAAGMAVTGLVCGALATLLAVGLAWGGPNARVGS